MLLPILILLLLPQAGAHLVPVTSWVEILERRLSEIDAAYAGELGVFVQDLDSGLSLSFRGDEFWYVASGIKVPVAIAVMRGVERGDWSLQTYLRLEESDYVDGAGQTNWHPPGARLTIEYLLEQTLIYSDNTATDMLIRRVGLEEVNRVTQEIVAEGFGAITTLADVRRHAYSGFHETAFSLSGRDFFTLRAQRDEQERIETLAGLLQVTADAFALTDMDSAFDAYYATDLNAARLSAFGRLLHALVDDRALQPQSSRYLLGLMQRVATGDARIKADLGEQVRFAHKTGTQRGRACDLGIATAGDVEAPRRLVIAACTRGSLSVADSERTLRLVGAAVRESGALQPTVYPIVDPPVYLEDKR